MLKYIYKGPDKAITEFVSVNSELESKSDKSVDEIKDYLDARYISAIEGVWHIFHFLMHSQDPPVMR